MDVSAMHTEVVEGVIADLRRATVDADMQYAIAPVKFDGVPSAALVATAVVDVGITPEGELREEVIVRPLLLLLTPEMLARLHAADCDCEG